MKFTRWAWNQVDKDSNGIASQKDIYRLIRRYNQHVSKNINIMRLIERFDKNKDRVLDGNKFQNLLSVRILRAQQPPAFLVFLTALGNRLHAKRKFPERIQNGF